ncbi:hypothetical protein FACS1894217_00890 [Clostridia bacterium]|nr:hypothetical protein FACS1894217_00890 [Clostridia bacterium]
MLAAGFSITLSSVLIRLIDRQERERAASHFKSSFLAHMSHEIRTPMNAVIGMSELALREPVSPVLYGYLGAVRDAGGMLLSIVNNVLDLSKLETGQLDLFCADYETAALVADAITLTQPVFAEDFATLAVHVDAKLPRVLNGDETRLRQIITGVLGEVAGDAILLVGFENGRLSVCIEYAGELKRGAGTNLAERLCGMMGGESDIGQGAAAFFIPQVLVDAAPNWTLCDPAFVLVFDERRLNRRAVGLTLDSLGARREIVGDAQQFRKALGRFVGELTHVFVPVARLDAVMSAVRELVEPMSAQITAVADYGGSVFSRRVDSVTAPLYAENLLLAMGYGEVGESRNFQAPGAKVLVVDDIRANLSVAEGLLKTFGLEVTCCQSGREAIELIGRQDFNLVLMDHMMPEMDGLQAAAGIRALQKSVPIIALTANAGLGVRELFLAHGMDDYLAKPINAGKLKAMLERWIPQELCVNRDKPPREDPARYAEVRAELSAIPQLDAETAVKLLGDWEGYLSALRRFYLDIPGYLRDMRGFAASEQWRDYHVKIHAVKSVFALLGGGELSSRARELEDAAKRGDTEYCAAWNEDFCAEVSAFRDALSRTSIARQDASEKTEISAPELVKLLQGLIAACETGKVDTCAAFAARLKTAKLEERADALAGEICALADDFEYDKAAEKCLLLKGMLL